LAITLPKQEGERLTEGDLSLSGPPGEWLADVAGGAHQVAQDEITGAPLLTLVVELRRREEAESALAWRTAQLRVQIAADAAQGELALDD
jgi:hypothetical protein